MAKRPPKPPGIPAQPRYKTKRKPYRGPSLNKLSRQWPTDEEHDKVFKAFVAPQSPPIVTAILGAACVEYELEKMLRSKYRKQDDDTWGDLSGRDGPLGNFSSKIISGYAFGFYDEVIRNALDTVRSIRNVFAHSKKPIDFDHEDIVAALRALHVPETGRHASYRHLRDIKKGKVKHESINFVFLCLVLYRHLVRKQMHAKKIKEGHRSRREKAQFAKSVSGQLAQALLQGQPQSQSVFQGLFGGLAGLGQSVNPKPGAPLGILPTLLHEFANPPGKTDKKE